MKTRPASVRDLIVSITTSPRLVVGLVAVVNVVVVLIVSTGVRAT